VRIAEAGGKIAIIARDEERLAEVRKRIADLGGHAKTYSCDITDYEANDKVAKDILKEFGRVDILINNAGRSIRRSLALSYDRFHDFERTMQLNYFACVRLTMNLLPSMTARKDGHVINVSSIGVLTNAPRFSAYVASKAALESFARCAASEFHDENVHFHDHQHATRAHADDRADQTVRGHADHHLVGRSRRHDRRRDHPQASAHRDAARRDGGNHAPRHAEALRGRHELGVSHVPGFGRGAGQARRRRANGRQIARRCCSPR
jgi:NADP-dependent 3-hydroxy acid dehydrogenase YdfG